jgi:hypothetical protein
MSRVVAAVDATDTAVPVLSAATALAALLGSSVDAVHVREGPSRAARDAAASAGVRLTELSGPATARLADVVGDPDVVAIVVGAHARRTGARRGTTRTGHVAASVATSTPRPVVVVPPDCARPVRLDRILVPIEAVATTAASLRSFLEALTDAGVDLVALHVLEEHALPPFTDQPHHEVDAWTDEFVRRYCHGLDVRLEVRTGTPAQHVLAVAGQVGAGGILLGWGQRLDAGRAALVRSVLEESRIPVILMPVGPGHASGRGGLSTTRRGRAPAAPRDRRQRGSAGDRLQR